MVKIAMNEWSAEFNDKVGMLSMADGSIKDKIDNPFAYYIFVITLYTFPSVTGGDVRLITRAAIIFSIIFLILFIFIGFQFWKKSGTKNLRAELGSIAVVMIQKQLDLVDFPVSKYLQDISLWDDTVDYMKTRSSHYTYENIDLSGELYNINETRVYTPGFKKIYQFTNRNAAATAGDLDPILPDIKNRFKSENYFLSST